jgi:hypothetical protein
MKRIFRYTPKDTSSTPSSYISDVDIGGCKPYGLIYH